MSECEREWDEFEFWIATHNAFLDLAILDWCKLFTETSGVHHWRASVIDYAGFERSFFASSGLSDEQFAHYCDNLRTYRNRFLAHLDKHNAHRLPTLTVARVSTKALLHWLVCVEDHSGILSDAPSDPEQFYSACFHQARAAARREA